MDKLASSEATERNNLERILSRADLLLSNEVVLASDCENILKEVELACVRYEKAVLELRQHFLSVGFHSRLEELQLISESLVEQRCPRTVAMLNNAIKSQSEEASIDRSIEAISHNEYRSLGVKTPQPSQHSNYDLLSELAVGTPISNQSLGDVSQTHRNRKPSELIIQNNIKEAEDKVRKFCNLYERERRRGVDHNQPWTIVEEFYKVYFNNVQYYLDLLQRDGRMYEQSELRRCASEVENLFQATKRFSIAITSKEIPEGETETRSCAGNNTMLSKTGKTPKNESLSKIDSPPREMDKNCMDLSLRFKEMSLVGEYRHDQANDNRNVSLTTGYLKEDKLSILRTNERETRTELSIQLTKAEHDLHKGVLSRANLDNLFSLEEKFKAASYKVQSEYDREDRQSESAEIEISRISISNRLKGIILESQERATRSHHEPETLEKRTLIGPIQTSEKNESSYSDRLRPSQNKIYRQEEFRKLQFDENNPYRANSFTHGDAYNLTKAQELKEDKMKGRSFMQSSLKNTLGDPKNYRIRPMTRHIGADTFVPGMRYEMSRACENERYNSDVHPYTHRPHQNNVSNVYIGQTIPETNEYCGYSNEHRDHYRGRIEREEEQYLNGQSRTTSRYKDLCDKQNQFAYEPSLNERDSRGRSEFKEPYIHNRAWERGPNDYLNNRYGRISEDRRTYDIDPYLSRQLKLELLKGIGEPFDGSPEHYWAWKSRMLSQIREAQTSALETLNVLVSNTIGKPNRLMKELLTSCYDAEETLHRAWIDLERRFGTSRMVSDCLLEKLSRFPKIEDAGKIQDMEDLLSLSRSIINASRTCSDLERVRRRDGLKLIWEKMPWDFLTRWKKISTQIERHGRRPPTPEELLNEISYYIEENSDPLFANVLNRSRSHKQKTLITDHRPMPETNSDEQARKNLGDSREDAMCIYHNMAGHDIKNCRVFTKLRYADKYRFATEKRLCFNCLGPHRAQQCNTAPTCSKCDRSHIELMHRDPPIQAKQEQKESPQEARTSCTIICGTPGKSTECRSKTVPVEVRRQGCTESIKCYAIIDEQSTASFCDPKITNELKLSTTSGSYSLSTMSGHETKMDARIVGKLEVKGISETTWVQLPELYTHTFIPDTSSEVAVRSEVRAHAHLQHLANNFPTKKPDLKVQLLLGVNSGGAMKTEAFGEHFPYAHHTVLGWCLVGPVCVDALESNTTKKHKVLRSTATSLCHRHQHVKEEFANVGKNDFIPRGFDALIESPDDEFPGTSKDDRDFLEIVNEGICTNPQGNIEIPLPLRPGASLPDNRSPVFYRTKNVLQRVATNPDLAAKCVEAMQKYLDCGHFEELPPGVSETVNDNYIPIFPVEQTKKQNVRLVFDSAAKYQGLSLNDALLRGPDVTNKLIGVLLRFRHHRVAFAGDIDSMFHAFYVPENQRDCLRFFWWKNNDPSSVLTVYRAKVHIFGNKSSPAVATYGLRHTTTFANVQHLNDAISFILENFYVDDGLGSAPTVEEAERIISDTKEILGNHNIKFHKIVSSHSKILCALPPEDLAKGVDAVDIARSNLQSALGITWKIASDTFQLRGLDPEVKFTRRGVLSVNSSIFDPLGMASPVTLGGRLLQRKFISASNKPVDWDETLPMEFESEWHSWVSQLHELPELTLPRCFRQPENGKIVERQLLVFADASEYAIAHVIYLKIIAEDGRSYTSFIFANAKVAPKTAVTIPRLELCAALEAAQSTRFILSELKLNVDRVYYYTDSRIVLGYLTNRDRVFSKFVTSRVQRIQKMSSIAHWNYVTSESNPADLATRPKSVRELKLSRWLTGPEMLQNELLTINPTLPDLLPETIEPTQTLCTVSTIEHSTIDRILATRSSWVFLIRVLSLVKKFIKKCRRQISDDEDLRTTSINLVCRHVQKDGFSEDYPRLEKGDYCKKISRLSSLSPFLDDHKVIRVGGRLGKSDLPWQEKHPILLPTEHRITTLILRYFHEKAAHQGAHITGGLLRQAGYHTFKSKSALRRLISSCYMCKKLRSLPANQIMANLPTERIERTPPFSKTGTDVFGPYLINEGKTTRRTKSAKKVWVLLLTCLYSRAIHLETLESLDITSLKLALRRFISTRGDCVKFVSDCGTNFVGAQNCLLDNEHLENTIRGVSKEYDWKFLPPRASHFAGVWERKVGSIKRILHVTIAQLGKSVMNREEFNTLVQEAACIVNHTPLSEISANPEDPLPVCPASILTLKEGTVHQKDQFSERDLQAYGKRRWRRVQFLADQFWIRWKRDYLKYLQTKKKWIRPRRNLSVGDVVLISADCPRNQWPLGLISEVYTNDDGYVRSVTVDLAKSVKGMPRKLRRAAKDIIVLIPNETLIQ